MKRIIRFLFIVIIIAAICYVIPYIHVLKTSVRYDDQYLDGIVFSKIEFFNHELKYCYHVLYNEDYKELKINILGNEEVIGKVSFENECSKVKIEEGPQDIIFENTNTNTKSILSLEENEDNYQSCKDEKSFPYEENEKINAKKKSISQFLSGKNSSIYYEDIRSGFSYGYNENQVYYGASLIKLPEALYLIDEAINDRLSLDETTSLDRYYYNLGNDGLKSHKMGSQISIWDLIKYMLETSDNGAHLLLFDRYAGSHIIAYEKSLGSPYTFRTGGDKYGYQTAKATSVYLKHAYGIISSNEEYGSRLKTYLTNDFYNNLDLKDGIEVAHKYGYLISSPNFHDIGLVFNENPYTISVLTRFNKVKGSEFINNVHGQVKELHELFYSEKSNYCLNKAYFNN